MTEEKYKRIKDSIELQSLVKKQMGVEDELLQEEIELLKAYEKLQKENKQLKEQLLATQTNEETFRLEIEDITKTLGLDEDTIFDDVKEYARNLKDNWDKLREFILEEGFEINTKEYGSLDVIDKNVILEKIRELEGSDSNE